MIKKYTEYDLIKWSEKLADHCNGDCDNCGFWDNARKVCLGSEKAKKIQKEIEENESKRNQE